MDGRRRRRKEDEPELIDHVGISLWRASRAWLRLFRERLAERGFADLTEGEYLSVLPNMDWGGTRITTLAERSNLTKQAISQFVQSLEKNGYVVRRPDPTDARAKIVRYTARGRAFVRAGREVKVVLDGVCSEILGEKASSKLIRDLDDLVTRFGERHRQMKNEALPSKKG